MTFKTKLYIVAGLLVLAGIFGYLSYWVVNRDSGFKAGTEQVQAKRTNDFLESVGVNLQLQRPYMFDNYSVVKTRLQDMGVRYARTTLGGMGVNRESFTTMAERMTELSNPGSGKEPIAFSLITVMQDDNSTSSPQNRCFLPKIKLLLQGGTIPDGCGGEENQSVTSKVKIAGIEGANEPDHCPTFKEGCQTLSDGSQMLDPALWADKILTDTAKLKTVIKGDTVTRDIPLESPSFVHTADFNNVSIGNQTLFDKLYAINDSIDQSNNHPYCNSSLDDCFSQKWTGHKDFYPTKAHIATETGWSTFTGDGGFTQTQQEKYTTRGLLTNFSRGIKKTYIYSFMDNPDAATTKERNFGIIKSDGTPKQTYTSLKNLFGLLSDTGSDRADFATSTLGYGVVTDSQTVRHSLMQKSDGSFWLAVMNDVAKSNDADTVARATIEFEKAMDVEVYGLTSSQSISTHKSIKSLNTDIPDRVVLMKLTLAQTVSNEIHISDIDRGRSQKGDTWEVRAHLRVHNGSHSAVGNANVTVVWSDGITKTTSCTTDSKGYCLTSSGSIPMTVSKVTFRVENIENPTYVYVQAGNHDVDNETDGTSVTTVRPGDEKIHISDIDLGAREITSSSTWKARVWVRAEDVAHQTLSGVSISGVWSFGGKTRVTSCTSTDSKGWCAIESGDMPRSATTATFTVNGMTKEFKTYAPSSNHDPESDSDGTTRKITAPR